MTLTNWYIAFMVTKLTTDTDQWKSVMKTYIEPKDDHKGLYGVIISSCLVHVTSYSILFFWLFCLNCIDYGKRRKKWLEDSLIVLRRWNFQPKLFVRKTYSWLYQKLV